MPIAMIPNPSCECCGGSGFVGIQNFPIAVTERCYCLRVADKEQAESVGPGKRLQKLYDSATDEPPVVSFVDPPPPPSLADALEAMVDKYVYTDCREYGLTGSTVGELVDELKLILSVAKELEL